MNMKFKYRCAICLAPVHTSNESPEKYKRTCDHRGAILVECIMKKNGENHHELELSK
jgi:hypothetical protein